ncbi:RagB/SusD family nutrient uptake outer membrane protein [Butyricimonas hominis]|uniref:RagB/SusD family nutrient uptake outer membrane protein n=1 Tax=Butyricimonas hominis TaxID=2763032 RepID=A0ABR7D4M4_9BACT|nr:RagB/SusD family nutrient uptake outer membrane protein [Butyricimonas hominis]MBC5622871.1 RagB/SusD family nutrient uptake outer membrane protein [Butyricimonas hominis]
MKTRIKLLLFAMAFILSSCESWLDLKPVTQATEEQIFSTAEGYRSTLNGLYKNMGKSSLYGKNLSFAMLDGFSQQYDLSPENNGAKEFQACGEMNYGQVQLAASIEKTWMAAYNVVANANNLIQNLVENTTPELFEFGAMERNMILGEAYACRALMHFDMLRLFAPAPISDDGANYVPYVEQYPNIQPAGISVKECINKVITDLEQARELVFDFDTSALAMNAVCTGDARFYNKFPSYTELASKPSALTDFFKGRGYRLNYYSITALLARAYQYAERYDDAFEAADAVLKFKYEASQWDKFTFYEFKTTGIMNGTDNRVSTFEGKSNLRLVDNLIFAVYNAKAYDELNLETYFLKESTGFVGQYFVVRTDDIFKSSKGNDESANDIRYTKMIFMAQDKYPVSGKWFYHEDEAMRKKNVTILPVIRGTEMQYIMAEYYARKGNWTEAANSLNEIRRARGCWDDISFDKWEDFVKELIVDARREWISEGQLFYLYKRLNADVDFGKGVKRPFKRQEAVVPMPASQSM